MVISVMWKIRPTEERQCDWGEAGCLRKATVHMILIKKFFLSTSTVGSGTGWDYDTDCTSKYFTMKEGDEEYMD